MSNVLQLFPDGVPPATPRPVTEGEVRRFRGRSWHRDRGCTCTPAMRDSDRTCPCCEWGAMTCAVCGGSEGELPADCPQVEMTEDERDAVMQGRADYIQAAGGWVRGSYVAGRFRCDGAFKVDGPLRRDGAE